MNLVQRRLGSARFFSGKGVAGARAFGEDDKPSERSGNPPRGRLDRSSRDDARRWAVQVGYRPGFGKLIRDGVCGISVGNTEFVGGRIQV